MRLDEFLARLGGVVAHGEQYAARCPAHEDEHTSLSITEGRDGCVLVTCHAGCTTESVVTALGLTLKDLFAATGASTREIVATYPYCDEHGVVLFEVVRFAPKDFRQRRPDGEGGWTWKLGRVRRVLYRLPELRAAVAAGRLIYIVEGEKDVHAVEAVGAVATCNPGGAGKWRSEYTRTLQGAKVIVVADRDAPGQKHAHAVAVLLSGTAASVGLREPAVGKDVSDHLAAGKKLSDLVPVMIEEPKAEVQAPRLLAPGPSAIATVLRDAGLLSLSLDPGPDAVEIALRRLRELVDGADPLRVMGVRRAAVVLLNDRGVKYADRLVGAAFRV